MGIFKIERMAEPADTAKSEVEEVKPVAVEAGQPAAVGADGTVAEAEPKQAFGLEEQTKPVVLKVDGPLGQVFTNTLNEVLAVESMVTIPMSDDALKTMQDAGVVPVIIHAQVLDESLLKSDAVFDLSQDAMQHLEENYVIAVESSGSRGKSEQLAKVERLGNLPKTWVKYSYQSAASIIALRAKELGV